jgi:predicted membrane protein
MPDDFFSDPVNKGARDPREYPAPPPDDWFTKPAAPPVAACRRGPHVGAVLLILAGVLFFLNNTGVIHIGSIFSYWPLILIAVGVSRFRCSSGSAKVWSLAMMAMGGIFLTRNLGLLYLSFNMVWPIALIGVGVLLLVGRMESGLMLRAFPRVVDRAANGHDDRRVHLFSFFGGVKRVMDTDDFRGGEALAVFGGVDLDLRLARMSGSVREVVVEADALFGGVNIRVPDNWRVAVRGIGLFGGYIDKTLRRKSDVNPDGPLLVVTGYAAFGGIEVQS